MIEKFLQYLQYEKSCSSHTVLSYRTDLLQFCEFLQVESQLFNPVLLHSHDIRAWILSMMESGMSPRSISRKISSLKSFWRYLLSRGFVDKNLTKNIILPKTNKQLPTFYRQGEMQSLLQKSDAADDFKSHRDILVINLLYQTGLRVSELRNLTDESFNLPEKELRVIGKGNKERIVPFGNELSFEILAYIKMRDEMGVRQTNRFFMLESGKAMYSKAIYNIVHREMLQVSTQHKHSPHVLRHTFATTLLNNGADINAIKELLGHSSLSATQVYTSVSFAELKKIYKQAHPRAIKKGG